MTEKELRDKVIETAEAWMGAVEGSAKHKEIIDLYNAHKPLARGYAVKYTDEWCATFVSAVAIRCGLTNIMPTECGCEQMINLYRGLGSFVESDNYKPQRGDVIFYDWQDSGSGENMGYADHVGFVVDVSDGVIHTIEGNVSNSVGYRSVAVDGRYIRGFAVPDYWVVADPVDYGDPDWWADTACRKAVNKGVFQGDGKGNFRWRDGITRQEMAVLLDNLGWLG